MNERLNKSLDELDLAVDTIGEMLNRVLSLNNEAERTKSIWKKLRYKYSRHLYELEVNRLTLHGEVLNTLSSSLRGIQSELHRKRSEVEL